jgi:hypothetical protein
VIDKEFGTLASIDLRCEGAMPGMFFRGDLAPARETRLRIDRVRDQQGLDAMIALVGECFDWPPEYLAQIYNRALMETPGWYARHQADEPPPPARQPCAAPQASTIPTTAKHRRRTGDVITRLLEEGLQAGLRYGDADASAGYPHTSELAEDSGEYSQGNNDDDLRCLWTSGSHHAPSPARA